MLVFKCFDCEKLFKEPQVVSECVGEFWGTPAYEDFTYCPYCGSESIDEIYLDEDGEGEEEC